MNLAEAGALADKGKAMIFSNGGDWKRYLRFSQDSDAERVIYARAYGRIIAVFSPDGIRLFAYGFEHHITTREAMNWCVSQWGYVYSKNNVIYAGAEVFKEGMLIPYDKAGKAWDF